MYMYLSTRVLLRILRKLWRSFVDSSILRISAGVRRQRRLLKPMVRLVANMQVSSIMMMMMMMMMIITPG